MKISVTLGNPCRDHVEPKSVEHKHNHATKSADQSANQEDDGPTKVCINMFIRSISKIDDVVMVRHL